MDKKNYKKTAHLTIGVALLATALSFVIELVPCKTTNAASFCKLPNPFSNISGLENQYYYISNNPISGFLLQLIISGIVFLLILGLFIKLNKSGPTKVIDLTKRR